MEAFHEALKAGDLDLAVRLCRQHLSQNPDDAPVHNILGVALQQKGKPAEALECYQQATRIAPTLADAWYNAGLLHHVQGRLARAEEHYEKALEMDPGCAEAHREYSMLRLFQGDFRRKVWSSFRHRRACAGFTPTVIDCPAPCWQGEPLAEKSILVYGEQGLGDEILFASCYPDLISVAKRCVIVCEPRLEALFRRSFPATTVIARNRDAELRVVANNAIAYAVPSGDLPLHFRQAASAFPERRAYLAADSDAVARWRSVLSRLGPGLKIGISWRGGTARTNQRLRSADFEFWRPIFEYRGAQLVSLQYGDVDEDLSRARNHFGRDLHHWPEAIANYDETAALVCALDMIITVTTSVAHLSGALGQETWILANAAPRWCYLASGSTSPWYPSATIFRQEVLGDWSKTMSQVAAALIEKSGKQAPDTAYR